ncbi:MAG: hypothetical protein E4G90_12140 [Gemmatimonadales bacterium]|nr:MAG: hypothetical protein E4G90_12140 [Gemmatimonadales bacterium]
MVKVMWEGTLEDVDDTTIQVRVTRDGDTIDALELDKGAWVPLLDDSLRLDAYEAALRVQG